MEGAVAMLKEVNRMQSTDNVYDSSKHTDLAGTPAQLAACPSFAYWKTAHAPPSGPIKLPTVCPPTLMLLGSVPAAQRQHSRVCGQLAFLNFFKQLDADARCRFMSMGGPGASGWLTAIHNNRRPWTAAAFQVALRIRLGLPVYELREGGLLCGCGERLTVDHCFACAAQIYVTHRHNNLRDELAKAGVEVGFAGVAAGMGAMGTVREVPIPAGGARGGLRLDVELCTYREGGDGREVLCGVDVSVVHAPAPSYVTDASAYQLGRAAHARAVAKTRKYRTYVGTGRIFRPAIWETYGRVGADALKLLDDISKSEWVQSVWGAQRGLMPVQASAQYRARLAQQCSLLLMQGNVQYCLLGRVRSAMIYHRVAPVAR